VRHAKLLMAAAITFAPASAFALDFTPDNGRYLSDPLYLPMQGQLEGTTSYSYSASTGHLDDAVGARVQSFDVRTDRIVQSLEYGLNDDLALSISDAYDPVHERIVHPVGGSQFTRNDSGLEDPTIGATWRVLDQNTNPFSLDLLASYSPNMISSNASSPTSDGSVARGGSQGSFGVGLGREMHDFAIRAGVNENWYGRSKVEDDTGASVASQGSYWNTSADLTTQTRLSDQFSLDAGVGYVFAHDTDLDNHVTGVDFVTRPGNGANARLGLNYNIVPNKFVVGLTYGYNAYETSHETSPSTPADNTATRDRKENVVGAKLDYNFN
jgi:hypothetical protein